MSVYTQSNRPMAITTSLGPDALLLTRLEGVESLSAPYCFSLDLLAEKPVAFDAVLGQPASIRIDAPSCPRRWYHGIIRQLSETGQVHSHRAGTIFTTYQAELVPRLWLLSLRTQSRVFQAVSVKDVLMQVFRDDWQLKLTVQLSATYLPRDYCVQYQESDLAFVSRLMEEEGIWYAFTHTEQDHTLILGDGPSSYANLAGPSVLTFDSGKGGLRPASRVTSWKKTQRLCSGKVALRDYSFQMPDSTLDASQTIQNKVVAGSSEHTLLPAAGQAWEIFEFPGGYVPRFDGVSPAGGDQPDQVQNLYKDNLRTAKLRIGQEAAAALVVKGKSTVGHLLPGCKFTLSGQGNGDGDYVLTRVSTRAVLEGSYVPGQDGFTFKNSFQALPLALPYRPARTTPRPVVSSVQTAVVVGPAGQDTFPDKYGRVKVKFYWDRRSGPGGLESSCWLRVAQVWAGNRWGAFFWPRIGHEVVVAFVEGNPDRPLVVGSVYNANNMPPFAMPIEKALGGIKSFSAGASPNAPSNPLKNFNGILFDDHVGMEHMEVHGERFIDFMAEFEHRHHVNGPYRLNVSDLHSTQVGRLATGSGGGGGSGGSGNGGSGGSGGGGDNSGCSDDSGAAADKNTAEYQATLDSLVAAAEAPPAPAYQGPSFQASPSTDMNNQWGAAVSSTCGVSFTNVLGANICLTVGQNFYLTVNPTFIATELGGGVGGAIGSGVAMAAVGVGAVVGGIAGAEAGQGGNPEHAGLAAGIAMTALGAPFGSVSSNFCNSFTSSYGYQLTVNRGSQASVTDEKNFKDPRALVETVLAGIISGLLTAGSFTGAYSQFDTTDVAWEYLLGIAGSLAEVLHLAQVIAAYIEQVKDAGSAGDAALTALDYKAGMVVADVLTALFTPGAAYNNVKATTGTVCEYADYKFIGATGLLTLFSGQLSPDSSVLNMNPRRVVLALGVPKVGPRLILDSMLERITLALGPDAVGPCITLDGIAQSITLQVGAPGVGPSITLDGAAESITFQVGAPGAGSSVIIDATGVAIQCASNLWAMDGEALSINVAAKTELVQGASSLKASILNQSVTGALTVSAGTFEIL